MKEKTLKTLQHAGEYGNACKAHGTITFEGDAISTAGGVFKLPGGCKITGAYFVNEALGASTTIKLDAVGESGSTAIITATSTVGAGKAEYSGKPIETTEEVTVTATVGGGAATGDLDVVIDYIYEGQ